MKSNSKQKKKADTNQQIVWQSPGESAIASLIYFISLHFTFSTSESSGKELHSLKLENLS